MNTASVSEVKTAVTFPIVTWSNSSLTFILDKAFNLNDNTTECLGLCLTGFCVEVLIECMGVDTHCRDMEPVEGIEEEKHTVM